MGTGTSAGLSAAERSAVPAVYANGRISFAVSLTPGKSWEGALLHDLIDGTIVCAAPESCDARV